MFNDKRKKILLYALIVPVIYVFFSFYIINDYGITFDEPENFGIGHKYLYFYTTGHLNFKDELPKIEKHPNFYNKYVKENPYQHWPFANILSAVTCNIFYQKLNLLDPISAHHIIIPIITAMFLFVLFLFVSKYIDVFSAFLIVLAILTYPRFFGHSFNNIKDVPELIFFSLTILLFAEWYFTKNRNYLFATFICWGIALSTKIDAILVPVILLIWLSPYSYKYIFKNFSTIIKISYSFILGIFLSVIVILIFYPPLLPWAYANNKEFLINATEFLKNIYIYVFGEKRTLNVYGNNSWGLYPFIQIFYATPFVMLVLFVTGLVNVVSELRKNRMYLLLVIWLAVPILIHCLPGVINYDGIRHFIVFIVPFTIIMCVGINWILRKCTKINRILMKSFLCILVFIPNFYCLVSYHPYQTTYFNVLVGGLEGAQSKNLFCNCDYWLNSYRKAGEWLDNNALENAYYYAYRNSYLLKYSVSRKDLCGIFDERVLSVPPPNTYIILVGNDTILSDSIDTFEIVYQLRRQGGKIVTIYYISEEAIKACRYFFDGKKYLKMKEYDLAIAKFKKSINIKPKYADVHNDLGVAYYYKGLKDKAVEEFKLTLKLKPEHNSARINLDKTKGR
jgi:hypothetical protein